MIIAPQITITYLFKRRKEDEGNEKGDRENKKESRETKKTINQLHYNCWFIVFFIAIPNVFIHSLSIHP